MKNRLLLVLTLLPVALSGCQDGLATPTNHRQMADIAFPIDEFSLTERSGAKVAKADLQGKVWIASFVFTRCTGPCPQITATMARLQSELDLANRPDLRLVTFTVDPARDDPAELRKYADHFRADASRWLFLTGNEREIHQLLEKSFKLPAARNETAKPGEEFDHSTRLAVVDKQGVIRGYFSGMADPVDPAALDASLKDLKAMVARLLRE
jgi:cytochrome oxidase Cu insertion factor (SCO1/SenC/PrrC family)